mmetsp:Transcript_39499/g.77720  ORF Transcript_39499/g.77720 Transcript_39499/m.77720 type:complete len:96 (+) Transcript_39499:609-896(+)
MSSYKDRPTASHTLSLIIHPLTLQTMNDDTTGTQEAVSAQWSSPPAKWFWFGMHQGENTRNTFAVGKDKEILRMHMPTRFREEVRKNTQREIKCA